MSIALRAWIGDLELTDYPFALEYGMNLGRPENIYTVLNDLLADGEPVTSARSSNRALTLPVLIEGSDFQELADNEALLIEECEKAQNALTIDPGDDYGPATVFDTFRVQANLIRNDNEEQAFLRRYSLEIQALPFGRSATETVVDAEAVSGTVTIFDECESTTGWSSLMSEGVSGNQGATFAVDSSAGYFVSGTGSLKVTPAGDSNYGDGLATASQRFKKTGLSIDASAGGYLIFYVRMEWPGSYSQVYKARVTSSGGGTQEATALAIEAVANSFVKYAIPVPDPSTITALDVDVWQGRAGPGGANIPRVWVDAIGLAPAASSAQQLKSFDVGGSMRSEGSFEVAGTAGLGDVLLYTCPDLGDGFRPDLRRWQTSGTSSMDTGAVNGTYVLSSASPTFEAPAAMFLRGDRGSAFAALIHVKGHAAGSTMFTVTAQTRLSGSDIGSPVVAVSEDVTMSTTAYTVFRVGVLDLPPNVVDPASGATVRFTVTGSGTVARIDELVVFPLEDAALTWVSCGEGASSPTVASRVWVDAPSPQSPRGRVLVGTNAQRYDARAVVPNSRGRHFLYPGRMLAYLLASAAAGGPGLNPRYFMRWHTNAASDG